MHGRSSSILTSKRIAQLEATNSALREVIASKDTHITMLEGKLLKMSVELASSRTREDEQRLMFRQSQLSQITMMSEDDGNHTSFDDSMKDTDNPIHPSLSSSLQSRFSFMPVNWGSSSSKTVQDADMLQDSARSGGVGTLIGNRIQLDRCNTTGQMAQRHSESLTASTSTNSSVRKSVGKLFRLSSSKIDKEELDAEKVEDTTPQRRRPNRTKLMQENQQQTSSRLISSTIAWPAEDDHSTFGFEEFHED